MTKHVLLSLSAGLLLATASSAQERCGSMDNLTREIAADPARGARLQQIDDFTQQYLATHPRSERGGGVVTIPVVWHVLYNTPAQNVPTTQIMAAMQQMNDDLARLNSDASNTPAAFQDEASATAVQFCLASRDPNGFITNGIVRVPTVLSDFPCGSTSMKFNIQGGDDAWPAGSYLNVWTCELSGGCDGFAAFPGGDALTDGVVNSWGEIGSIAQQGPSQNARTNTHELGHWLNLRHIWGDDMCGDDLVNDTPTQNITLFNCPTWPLIDCSSGPDGVMFCNYMDYTDENCINMFTAGQADRMEALFVPGGDRASLATSMGCVPGITGCATSQLRTAPGSTLSCGATGKVVGATGNNGKIWANNVTGANRYQFEFTAIGYKRSITSTTSQLVLSRWYSLPLLCGTNTYNVRVRISTNGGVSWCPFGNYCTVSITNNYTGQFCTPTGPNAAQAEQRMADDLEQVETGVSIRPNPNTGGELFINVNDLNTNATNVTVDIVDLMGRTVMSTQLPAVDGGVNSSVVLSQDMRNGLYIVNVTCAGERRSERLMVQR
jgi:Pregnancy-associated plasma protein-A/Secretion system C-terminal sorting domain